MKTVKVSCRVAKPAWDQTVGGVRCDDALNRYRLGHSPVPIWWGRFWLKSTLMCSGQPCTAIRVMITGPAGSRPGPRARGQGR